MERQRRRSRLDEPRPELEARARAVLDAAPHLHRDRDVDRARDRGDDPHRELRILHQMRAGAGLRHLADGAAEVHVDDVRARRTRPSAPPPPSSRLRAEDLDRERMLVGRDAQIAERPLVAVPDPGGRDHLRAHEPRAEAAALAAEGLDRDAGHRREHDPRRHLDPADRPRVPQVHRHSPMVSASRLTTLRRAGYHPPPPRGTHAERPFLVLGAQEATLKEVILTSEGFKKLQAEIEQLSTAGRREVAERIRICARVRRHRRERRVRLGEERPGPPRGAHRDCSRSGSRTRAS